MTSIDPPAGDDTAARDIRELRDQLGVLRGRLDRIEEVAWMVAVGVTVIALVAGFFLPFLTEADSDDPESITMLPMAFSAADDASGGPFSGEAAFASVLIGLLALGTVIAIVCVLLASGRQMSRRTASVTKVLTGIYLVGALGTWVFVLAFAGHFDGTSAFSPATLSLTIGAVLAFLLCRSKLAVDDNA